MPSMSMGTSSGLHFLSQGKMNQSISILIQRRIKMSFAYIYFGIAIIVIQLSNYIFWYGTKKFISNKESYRLDITFISNNHFSYQIWTTFFQNLKLLFRKIGSMFTQYSRYPIITIKTKTYVFSLLFTCLRKCFSLGRNFNKIYPIFIFKILSKY